MYDAKCRECHEGSHLAPELKSEAFLLEWDGKTLRQLYSRIISTMPSADPGSLTEHEVLDILTYLLQENGFPARGHAFERANDLNTIRFARGK